MSKYCLKCRAEIEDDALFCNKCGEKQEEAKMSVEDIGEENTEFVSTEQEMQDFGDVILVKKDKRKRIFLSVIIGLVATLAGCLMIFFLSVPKGLVDAEEIEQKLSEAYRQALGGKIEYNGVVDFEIKNVDEEEYDQTFSCYVYPSKDGSNTYTVRGEIKKGKVVQIRVVGIWDTGVLYEQDENIVSIFGLMPMFPISIVKEEDYTIDMMAEFFDNMKWLSAEGEPERKNLVEDDIEYTYIGGKGDFVTFSAFNIRYLPAFSGGYIVEGEEEVVQDKLLTATSSPKETTNTTPTVLCKFVQNELYEKGSVSKKEYIPVVTLYNDNSFEFFSNEYAGMATYYGTWTKNENEYAFNIEQYDMNGQKRSISEVADSTLSTNFIVYYRTGDKDAILISNSRIGMTGGEDIAFDVEDAPKKEMSLEAETSSAPISQMDDITIGEITSGKRTFLDFDTKKGATIYSLPSVNTRYMGKPGSFAVVDLDGDGSDELMIEYDASGDTAVLSIQNGKCVAYYMSYRSRTNLKTDGTMSWSNGAFESGTQRVLFNNDGMASANLITYLEDDFEKAYSINGVPVSKEECENALSLQYEKKDVEWLPLG